MLSREQPVVAQLFDAPEDVETPELARAGNADEHGAILEA
jgi:hypothetical protein